MVRTEKLCILEIPNNVHSADLNTMIQGSSHEKQEDAFSDKS